MEYTRLGRSGLRVSRVGLGCMSYGRASSGMHQWTLDEDEAAPFFRQAVELGVTFWDTANVYQGGTSEEFVGRAVRLYSRREDIVLATKVHGKMHDGPGGAGLSRKAILEQLDASLRRLDTDYVDVYYLHRFDDQVPVEETMETLHDVVRAGKVRYLGASSMWAWQFAKMQHVAERNGWTKFTAMQDQYNVLKREEERDMIPLCLDQGVGLTPYSPLAKGRAARPWGSRPPGRPPMRWPSRSTAQPTSRSSTLSRRSPRTAACRWHRSHWRGCCRRRSSPVPSWGPPSPITLRTRSPRWVSGSQRTSWRRWKGGTPHRTTTGGSGPAGNPGCLPNAPMQGRSSLAASAWSPCPGKRQPR